MSCSESPLDEHDNPRGFSLLLEDFYFRLEEKNKWNDHSIKCLIQANGGGVAILFTLIGYSINNGAEISPLYALPIVCFVIGIFLIGSLIQHATENIKTGRDSLRADMESLIERVEGVSYKDIFLRMGNNKLSDGEKLIYPSKWDKFKAATTWSFVLFISGVCISGILFAFVPLKNLQKEKIQARVEALERSNVQNFVK